MHTFQPYPMNMLEFNPFQKIGSEWAAVTAEADGKANAMTVSWGGVGVMWGKNVATIYIRDSRYTKELIDASDTFSINFFEDDHMHSTLNYLGKVSGHNEDKIAGARLHINHMTGTPFLDEAKFVILCKKLSATRITADQFIDPTIADKWYADGDMHTMYRRDHRCLSPLIYAHTQKPGCCLHPGFLCITVRLRSYPVIFLLFHAICQSYRRNPEWCRKS